MGTEPLPHLAWELSPFSIWELTLSPLGNEYILHLGTEPLPHLAWELSPFSIWELQLNPFSTRELNP